MNRRKWVIVILLSFVLLLGLGVVLLNVYSVARARAALTPFDTHFDSSLPGRTIAENGLNADFFTSASERPRKVVIILGGSEGGKHWSTNRDHIQKLLDRGYCVLVLAYFHAPGLPEYLREIPLEYFEKAFQWLAKQKEVVADDYAVFGHSRGGELALLLASRFPQIKAVIALVPSSVVFPSSPQGLFDVLAGQHSPWTYQRQALPFVPWPVSLHNAPSMLTYRQTGMFKQALQNRSAVASAIIPVENIKGPILCISATQDEVWPSTMMCSQIVSRLDEKGFSFFHDHIRHDQTHGWCGLETCWPKVVKFLDEHFK
ncbi:MAG: alpha/beta fold hydrolase [Verrucomicrobia bacterium]|nr:alpha/beta fold hydrolase [Verrucomicrobiota bacterium]